MDEEQRQLENLARQAQEVYRLLDESYMLTIADPFVDIINDLANSSARIAAASAVPVQLADTAHFASMMMARQGNFDQMQAFIEMATAHTVSSIIPSALEKMLADIVLPPMALDALQLAVTRFVTQASEINDLASGAIMQLNSVYTDMIAAVTTLHRMNIGIGATLTVTWGEDDESAKLEERRLVLPLSDSLVLTDEAEAELIKLSPSANQENKGPLAQTIAPPSIPSEESFGLAAVDMLAALHDTPGSENFFIARTENRSGLYGLNLIAKGYRAAEKINAVHVVAHSVMTDTIPLEVILALTAHHSQPHGAADQAVVNLGRSRPGRKVDAENIEAYQIVVSGYWSSDAYKQAFAIWCERRGIQHANKSDRNAFKKAMQRRKKHDE